MSAKFGVVKKLGGPHKRLLAWPLNRRFFLRPSVPGTAEVLRSNVLSAVLIFGGMSGRPAAETMVSFGVAMRMASMKSV